jgi:hypothetical protein
VLFSGKFSFIVSACVSVMAGSVALAAPVFPVVRVNGVDTIGLAGLGDKALPADKHLRLGGSSAQEAVQLALTSYDVPAGTPDADVAIIDRATALIVLYKWHDVGPQAEARANWVSVGDAKEDSHDRLRSQAAWLHGTDYASISTGDAAMYPLDATDASFIDKADRAAAAIASLADAALVGEALLLIGATKIHWYKANHHVGQTRDFNPRGAGEPPPSYVVKIGELVFGGNVNPGTVSLMHTVSHYASTAWVIGSMYGNAKGVDGGYLASAIDNFTGVARDFPAATEDMLVRLMSAPAGAAKLDICKTCLSRMARTAVCAVAIGVEGTADVLAAHAELVNAYPMFHLGARALAVRPPDVDATVSEEVLALCSIYVHTIIPRSTLARARVLMNIDDARAILPEVATNLEAMRIAGARAALDNAQLQALMAPREIAATGNPLAAFTTHPFDLNAAVDAMAAPPASAAAGGL